MNQSDSHNTHPQNSAQPQGGPQPEGRTSFSLGSVGSAGSAKSVQQPPQQVGDARQTVEATASSTFYEQVGGHETFAALVHEFYVQVAQDPEFRALYPEDDLAPAERRLLMFLEQYWGGPTTYSQERGHPRLRMRHMPFPVDSWARETWLKHMRTAMDSVKLSPLHDGIMWDYFDRAARALTNRPD